MIMVLSSLQIQQTLGPSSNMILRVNHLPLQEDWYEYYALSFNIDFSFSPKSIARVNFNEKSPFQSHVLSKLGKEWTYLFCRLCTLLFFFFPSYYHGFEFLFVRYLKILCINIHCHYLFLYCILYFTVSLNIPTLILVLPSHNEAPIRAQQPAFPPWILSCGAMDHLLCLPYNQPHQSTSTVFPSL